MSNWTWLDEATRDLTEEELDKREPRVKIIADMLSDMRHQREQEGFARQAELEERGHFGPEFENDAEGQEQAERYMIRQQIQVHLERAQEHALEQMLYELGARMCRPYEHYNEEEALMRHLEGE